MQCLSCAFTNGKKKMELNDLAGILYMLDNHDDFSDADSAMSNWESINSHFKHEDCIWYNRKHNGDYTKTAHTCFTCMVEKYESGAKKLIDESNIDSDDAFEILGAIGDHLFDQN